MKLSVVIPCFNEGKNIPLIVERFFHAIKRQDIEIILVDNGSTDNSRHIIDDLLPKYPFLRVVSVKDNLGYGFGILSGLKEARGEYVGWTHADMQTDPGDVIKGLALIERSGHPQKVFVKGNRSARPAADRFFTWGMGIFESLYLRVPLDDINAQPTMFHQSFFARWDSPPYDFALDLYAFYMARKFGLDVVRFPVLFPARLHGHSSWNIGLIGKWKFIKRTLVYSVALKKRLA